MLVEAALVAGSKVALREVRMQISV